MHLIKAPTSPLGKIFEVLQILTKQLTSVNSFPKKSISSFKNIKIRVEYIVLHCYAHFKWYCHLWYPPFLSKNFLRLPFNKFSRFSISIFSQPTIPVKKRGRGYQLCSIFQPCYLKMLIMKTWNLEYSYSFIWFSNLMETSNIDKKNPLKR